MAEASAFALLDQSTTSPSRKSKKVRTWSRKRNPKPPPLRNSLVLKMR